VSPMKFAGAVAAAALAMSSAVLAQTAAQEPLTQATQLVAAIAAAPQSDAGRLIATLKQDFSDFAAAYRTTAAPAPTGTAGAVGTSGVADPSRSDWRAKYGRVEADLAALLGPPTGAPPSPAAGVALDQATRSQLEMVRSHLQLFYAATMSAPDGNPVAHTGAPQTATEGAASRPPVAPTGEAPQMPPAAAPQSAGAAAGSPLAAANTRLPQVETDLGMAMTLLDRMQRILDDAIAEPGKLKLDRGSVDEIRAEIEQIRSMLRAHRQ
jgi:hypothetical protein